MKKFLISLAAALLVGVMAVSLAACSKADKVKVININLSEEQYGVAIQKGNDTLKGQINDILNNLNGEGVEVGGKKVTFDSLYEAEMNAADNNDLISIGSVKTESSNRANELVVATNAEFAPFEYMVGDSFGGIDMQVAKIIASALNKDLVIKHMAFEAVIGAVNANQADIALAGLTINEDRLKEVDFSVAYYNTTQQIAVLADDTTFDECKTEADVVTVLKGLSGVDAGAAKAQTGYYYLTGNESFEFDGYSNINTKQYNTIALAVQDLANGKLKFVCGDKDTIAAAVKAVNK